MTAELSPPRGRRPRNRKAQLAEAAAELFGKRGYHAVGVNDIAAAAGITGPALYRHFPNKQALLGHVLLTGVDVLIDRLDTAIAAAHGDPERCVGPLLHAAAEVSIEQRELTALWRWQGRHLHAGDQQEIRRRMGGSLARYVTGLRGLRPELDRADTELLTFAVMSVYGSVGDHHVNYAREPFERLLARLAEAVVRSDVVPAAEEPAAAAWRSRAQPAASRREELLSAATRLFRERGYHAVSMEDIGAVTGIAGPSIYKHFAAKSDILLASCRRMADRLHLGLEHALAEATDPVDALHRLTRSYADTVQRSDDLISVYTSELVNLPERDAKELRRLQRSYVAEWVRLLRETAPGSTEAEARVAVHAALTVINDLPRSRRFAARPTLTAETAEIAMAILREAARPS
ncbi:Transcriptional regulator, TetR family [Alloactinosynnema sp. L-07]|uniref:TetR/AcrR family transcriptional regulator n=1 Tax=Alloactinosynnema sp. L-07 TaxID=1653480 RepID=UPI00065F097B|nr:TetR/AcrR family transcriptional regulator [Alloactinosynnema sp. L-07]CRK55960.1 Transcriptional regulator, TetR family [Alloactinosynnema sp. L-07]